MIRNLITECEDAEVAVVVKNTVAKDVATDQRVESLRAEKGALDDWNRGKRKRGMLRRRSRNVQPNIELVGWNRRSSSGRSQHRDHVCGCKAQLRHNRRVSASSTGTSIN